MPSTDWIERFGKLCTLLGELAKGLLSLALASFVVGAFAAPAWISGRLDALGLKIDSINAGLVKIVAREAPKANAGTLQAVEAITEAEVRVANSVGAADASAVLEQLRKAKTALDAQSVSLNAVAGKVGLEHDLPATAWLYVGYFDEAGKPARLNDRLDPSGLRYEGGKISSLSLKFDAPVVSDGDDCRSVDIADVKPTPKPAAASNFMILRANSAPLEVLQVARCESKAGRGKQVYAQVKTPGDRVRFANLATVGR